MSFCGKCSGYTKRSRRQGLFDFLCFLVGSIPIAACDVVAEPIFVSAPDSTRSPDFYCLLRPMTLSHAPLLRKPVGSQ